MSGNHCSLKTLNGNQFHHVCRGPSDVIHDLHAKYETAVNKAERVAEEAIKFTAESLNEQGRCHIEI